MMYDERDNPVDECPEPECHGIMVLVDRIEEDTDADGNRGRWRRYYQCNVCGYEDDMWE